MQRVMVWTLMCALVAADATATELGMSEPQDQHGAAVPGPHLDLSGIRFDAAAPSAPAQTPTSSAQPPAPVPTATPYSAKTRALYFITLGAGVAGSLFNIAEVREGLDRNLGVKTFPLIWKTWHQPSDKNSATGVIAGFNFGLMGAGGVLYAREKADVGSFLNALVAAASTLVALHDRSVINDDKAKHP